MARGGRYQRRHKYNVGGPETRTFEGVVYDSKAEMSRAVELDLLCRVGEIFTWRRQVNVPLGKDFSTIVDFLVCDKSGEQYAEEVKGDASKFGRTKRLWRKYGPYRLRVLTRNKAGTAWKKIEWIEGKKE